MDSTPSPAPDLGASRRWAERAAARSALFEARDAMSAAFLQRAGLNTLGLSHATARSPGAPPFVFALAKPVAPRSWWKRRAFTANQRKRRQSLEQSGLFDAAWYLSRYPDVAQAGEDGLTHFLNHGSFEGRSPGPNFDAIGYLARYPDVVNEGIEPWLHYVRHGKAEGRSPI